MSIFDAIVLGIIEGLTEFLPVSSSAHLLLASKVLGISSGNVGIFSVVVQVGAVLAIVIHFYKELFALCSFSKNPIGFSGYRGIALLVIGTLPAVLVGFMLKPYIYSFFTEKSVAFFLILGAIYILLVEKWISPKGARYVSLDAVSMKLALYIGLFQCLALFPGFSRSTATIMGGLLLGFSRGTAVRFSFLLAIPIICGASLLETISLWGEILQNIQFLLIAGAVAFIVSMLVIKCFLYYIERNSYIPFAIYRVIVGCILFAMLYV